MGKVRFSEIMNIVQWINRQIDQCRTIFTMLQSQMDPSKVHMFVVSIILVLSWLSARIW